MLSFLWQLDSLPPEVYKLEQWALRRLAPGPGNWICPTDLCHLRKFGAPFHFPSFHHLATAAKLRLKQFEPQLAWNTLKAQVTDIVGSPSIRSPMWTYWYRSSPILTVVRTVDAAAGLNITADHICTNLRRGLRHTSSCEHE